MKTDILIIGAGPVGLMAALLLSNQGISSIIVDRRFERLSAPKAHAVNPRTIEICDAAGLSGDAIRAEGSPPHLAGLVRFASKLNGVQFGTLPYERQTDDALDITPFPLINISQPRFETAVAAEIQNRKNVALMRGAECQSLKQTAECIHADIHFNGNDAPLAIAAKYVLAADGAGSRSRDALGIEMEGPDALQNHIMIHCEGDLSAYASDPPGVLTFTFDPTGNGVFIFYDDMKTWVFMKTYDPSKESPDAYDEARCRREVNAAIGAEDAHYIVKNISPWQMTAQIAKSYRKDRVFLIGDAAHRFPPTGGLGLNTGVGDAHNLMWKLAAVLKGYAGEGLLDTYETERRPVAVNNSTQSMTNAAKIFEVIAALYGNDPEKTGEHFAKMCTEGSKGPGLEAAIKAQRPHFDSIKLQLGYRYHSDALIGSNEVATSPDDDISVYTPSYEVGALVPHAWTQENVSLLSQLAQDRFTLLCGPTSEDWKAATDGIDLLHFVPCRNKWPRGADLPDDGALLVRPDGHIAARYHSSENASATRLKGDLATILSATRTVEA